MDEFYEQYNGKNYGSLQNAMNSIEYASLLLLAVAFLGLRSVLITIFMLIVYVSIVYFNRNKFVAYEYELTKEALVISKVMGEKRRKTLISFELSDIEAVSERILEHKKCKVINALFNDKEEKIYIYIKTNKGLKCVGLNMDKKMLGMCYRLKPGIFSSIKR